MLTTTYVPVDTNKWPVVAAPYIYRTNADVTAHPNRGTAGYVVRADCTDSGATLWKSTTGIKGSYTQYTRGTAVTMAVGANIYFKATRGNGYRDSAVTFFANTVTSLPVNNDGGGGGGGNGDPNQKNPA
jgi:hypothetical protein